MFGCSSAYLGLAVLKEMSWRDRLERKKYMEVWRWESELTAKMMSLFPRMVTRLITRNRLKMMGCYCGSSVSPRTQKSEIPVYFLASMGLWSISEWVKQRIKYTNSEGYVTKDFTHGHLVLQILPPQKWHFNFLLLNYSYCSICLWAH